jgi:hypothetical protein
MCQFLPSHNQKNAWHIAPITAVEEEVPAQYAASKSLRHVDNFGRPSGEVPPPRSRDWRRIAADVAKLPELLRRKA